MVAHSKSSKCKEDNRSSASDYLQAMAKELATMAYSHSLTVMARCFEMAAKEAERSAERETETNAGKHHIDRSRRKRTAKSGVLTIGQLPR